LNGEKRRSPRGVIAPGPRAGARDSSIVIPELQSGFNGNARCGYDSP